MRDPSVFVPYQIRLVYCEINKLFCVKHWSRIDDAGILGNLLESIQLVAKPLVLV